MEGSELRRALGLLGELLERRGHSFDLVVIGGGALLLQNLIGRPTLDLDTVARVAGEKWVPAKPLPNELVRAIRDVAVTLGLQRQPDDDWLNGDSTVLIDTGLPKGFADRAMAIQFGSLTIRVAARPDLICLKLWAATDTARGARRNVDIADLKELDPTIDELRQAVRWCCEKDGRNDFADRELSPIIEKLGHHIDDLMEASDG